MNINGRILGWVGGGIALVAGAAAAFALLNNNDPGPDGKPYEAVAASDLLVVQRSAHTYDVSFAVPEDLNLATVALQQTDSPDYSAASAQDVRIEVEGDRVAVADLPLAAGDHFFWLISGETRIPVVVTVPETSPRVWMDGERPTIQFDEAPTSSWSSYVDPEGKNVYVSPSDVFGPDAVPLAQHLPIVDTSFRVDNPDPAKPFYYLVFVGRDGDATFVSSPLFATAEQGQLTVELRGGETPLYVIDGFVAARQSATDRTHALRVGSYDFRNPASTFMVENTSPRGDEGYFHFEVPALELAQGYSDLALFLSEDGATLEWSLDASGVDLTQRVMTESSVFGMRRAEALQLTRVDLPYETINVTLTQSAGSARLNVSGTFTAEAASVGHHLVLKDTTGERHETSNTASGDRFSFSIDLAQLDQPGVWYDVEFGIPGSEASIPISTLSVRDMTQWAKAGDRTYAFADYEGLLKVFFDSAPFQGASVTLTTVDGVPSLVATGRLVDTANADARLRIRTGDTVVADVNNTATQAGQFRFVFDLRLLPKAGTWYDVVFHKVSTDQLTDFRVEAVRDMSQSLEHNFRTYGFREWEGQLKVAFDAIPPGVDVTSAVIIEQAGQPVLRVEGPLDRATASDVFLRIRSGSHTVDVANSSATPGQALFVYNLSGLQYENAWYDLLIGTHSSGDLVDVPSSVADLSSSLRLDGRAYAFHDWNGQLKVAFADASVELSPTSAELVDVAGTPTLAVTGTFTGTVPNGDVFLRVRSGSGVVDVPNDATTEGEFAFAFDVSALTDAGTWYDLLVGVHGSSQLEDLKDSIADMGQTLMLDGRTYAFREWAGDLKVTFENTPVAVTVTGAALLDVAGVPTLRVTGTVTGTEGADVFVRVRTGAQTLDVASIGTGGAVQVDVDLTALSQAGTWYDLLIGVTSTSQLVDIRDDIATVGSTLTAGGRTYALREWAHDLKVEFTAAAVPAVTVTAAELVDVDSDAVLRVTGTVTHTTNDDVFLRVRSGAFEANVPNTAVTAGQVLFEYPLAGLEDAGNWYDLLVGITSTDALADLSDSVADMDQTLARDGRRYEFHEWGGNLKVAFADVSVGVTVTGAQLTTLSGAAVMVVAGTVEGTANSDAALRVGSGAGTMQVANSASAEGEAQFVFQLSQLTDAGTWYDVKVGTLSNDSFADVKDSDASMSDTVGLDARLYQFREWMGDLKVMFEDAPPSVQVGLSELAIVAGEPTLRVTGDVANAPTEDAFLRIGTGGGAIDVANAAVDPGDALFEQGLSGLDAGTYALAVGLDPGTVEAVAAATASGVTQVALEGRTYTIEADAGALVLVVADTPEAIAITQVEIVNLSGVPTLRVTGTVTGTPPADAYLEVGSGAESHVVANSASAAGAALFLLDLRDLESRAVWYDIRAGLTSTGDTVDATTAQADMGQTITVDNLIYQFRQYAGDLKVEVVYGPASVTATSAQLLDVDGVPTLRVDATVTGTTVDDTFLRLRSGAETYDATGVGSGGNATYDLDVSQLTEAGTWYDVLTGITTRGTTAAMGTSVANMAQTITVDDRRYEFKEWSGQLKVNWVDVSATIDVTSVELVNVGGVPTLQASGTATNVTASDVFLRVRSGAFSETVTNASGDDAVLSFSLDLSTLTTPGTWYDVVVGRYSVGGVTDVPSSAATMSQTISVDGRDYRFESWSNQLKVAFSATTLAEGERILIDFGPNDVTNGNVTSSPSLGNTWNNVSITGSPSNVVPNGLTVSGLKTTDGTTTTTSAAISSTTWKSNGRAHGGLLAPTEANLGDLAVGTATEDYFFVEAHATGQFTISGLDPNRAYDLRFFGTRNATGARSTSYSVTGHDGTQSATLQTSGTGIGAGGYNGNNNTTVTVSGNRPNADGTLQVSVVRVDGQDQFGYLGIMEIVGGDDLPALPPPPPAEMARWVAQDALDPVAPDSVLFVGSSSIRRWEFLDYMYNDYNIIRRGWGGSWLSGVNDNAPWVVHPYQPAAIVMWAGTNDLTGGTSPEVILERFQTFVAGVRAESPGTKIAWITLLPNPNNLHLDVPRRATNQLVIEWAEDQPDVSIIDVATPFEDLYVSDWNAWNSMFNDALHLSRPGYEFWNQTVRPGVEAMLAPNKVFTPNASTLVEGERLLFDFGPSNAADGTPTDVDANGHHWNNWYPTNGNGLVNSGEHVGNLKDDTGRNTGIGAVITGGFQVNGIQTGGLRNPDAGLLGDFAIDSVTQDFFFSSASDVRDAPGNDLTGSLMLTGLDPTKSYDFEFFGSRAAADTRITEYAVLGANSGSAQLQTTGTGIGTTGGNGNNSQIATVTGIMPDAFGQVFIDVHLIQGSYAYLNAMSVAVHEEPVAPPAPLGVGERLLVDFGPNDVTNGNVTVSPALGNTWNNVSIYGTPNSVTAGTVWSGLQSTAGVTTTTSVTAGANWKTNGLTTGGLLAPTEANLGDLAVATATQDYFFVEANAAGVITIGGLDPALEYDLRFFGTRNATGDRRTSYSVTGLDGVNSAMLQTSGTGIGAGGDNGNNNTTALVAGNRPLADGTLQVSVQRVAGYDAFGYLAIMEITGSEPAAEPLGMVFEGMSLLAEEGAILPEEVELPDEGVLPDEAGLAEDEDASEEPGSADGDPADGLNGPLGSEPGVLPAPTGAEVQGRRKA